MKARPRTLKNRWKKLAWENMDVSSVYSLSGVTRSWGMKASSGFTSETSIRTNTSPQTAHATSEKLNCFQYE